MFPSRIASVLGKGALENNYSLDFDGSDDYVDCGNDASLQITGNMTVSAWVKSSSSDRQRFITKYGSGGDDSFYLSIRPSTGYFRFNAASGEAESSTDVADGNWHHLVAQYTTSTKLEVFIDGSSDGTDTSSIDATMVNSTQNLRIGIESDDEYPMVGNIDEVSIFNAIVSVGDLRNGSSGQGNAVPADLTGMSNLQGWWRMGDGVLDDFNLIADQTNATLGSEAVTNGGASGQTDWTDTNEDGLADSWLKAQTATIVTDNGFTGNAQRIENDGGHSNLYQNSIVSANTAYKLIFKYRANYSLNIYTNSASNLIVTLDANTGDAISHTIYFTDANGGELRFYQANGAGRYFEVDEVSLKPVNGNAGIMTNMASDDIVKEVP